jgi:hypothetical protein
MNNDQDTLLRAIEDAGRILGEYIQPGPRDATQPVGRLMVVLDNEDCLLLKIKTKPAKPEPAGTKKPPLG